MEYNTIVGSKSDMEKRNDVSLRKMIHYRINVLTDPLPSPHLINSVFIDYFFG